MSTAQEKARRGMAYGVTAGQTQAQIDRSAEAEVQLSKVATIVPLRSIHPRTDDTRPAKASHVLALAHSIAAVGLVQPLAVDRNNVLIAGLHRLEAMRLLMTKPADRPNQLRSLGGKKNLNKSLSDLLAPSDLPEPFRAGRVPVRCFVDLDVSKDPDAAMAAEAAENMARAGYTREEMVDIAAKLRRAGYVETSGRPRKGTKALRPALELVLGRAESTILRLLGRRRDGRKGSQLTTFSGVLGRTRKDLDALVSAGRSVQTGVTSPAIQRALHIASKLAEVLPKAISDAKELERKSGPRTDHETTAG